MASSHPEIVFVIPAEAMSSDAAPVGSGLSAKRGVSLEPWDDKYMGHLSTWNSDKNVTPLFGSDPTGRFDANSLDQVFARGVFFLIFRRAVQEPIGFAYAERSVTHFKTYLFIDKRYRGMGVGASAAGVFFRYLFENFNVPKVSFDIPGWDTHALETTFHVPLVELEGIRVNHLRSEGKLFDLYEFGFSRENFSALARLPLWKRLVGYGSDAGASHG